ncbi:hypothetical protein D3C75_1375990 [compost metagenome]
MRADTSHQILYTLLGSLSFEEHLIQDLRNWHPDLQAAGQLIGGLGGFDALHNHAHLL